MAPQPLPQEIILLLCEELAARRDFDTLFQCSLVSRRVARIALEKLYSIQESCLVGIGETVDRLKWAQLWRSIILSATGNDTAYPYCAYVRFLSFGNFEEFLQDMSGHQEAGDLFLQSPMQDFIVMSAANNIFRRLNFEASMVKCAESITTYIKMFADETGTASALAHLEGAHFPYDILPRWISRLGTLKSLKIRDGSVLGVEAAKAIKECCPSFSDLTCYFCSSADEDLAAFFQTLRPNSLQSFEVISQNLIGEKALTALNAHSKSLRSLILGSLPPQGIMALNSLASCTALERLSIEDGSRGTVMMYDTEDLLEEISAWISSCKSLRVLSFNYIVDVLHIVKNVLATPNIRIRSLSVVGFNETLSDGRDISQATWAALGTQDRLESLTLGMQNGAPDSLEIHKDSILAKSILNLSNLTSLNLIQAYAELSLILDIPIALTNLKEFSFSGDNVEDPILGPLSTLSKLKHLSINSISCFTYLGLLDFIEQLATHGQKGIRVDILNQFSTFSFSVAETNTLRDVIAERLNGRIEITYTSHPDELHEEDFSDLSD